MTEDNTEITFSGFGKSASVKGLFGFVVICVLALAGFLGWLLYGLTTAASTSVAAAITIQQQTIVEHRAIMAAAERLKEHHEMIIEGVKKVDQSVKTQNYILLEDQAGRDKIKRKMQMPQQLRDLLNDRE